MCNVCCKEFKGWCKSFTRTERLLSVLEAIFLVLLLVFLLFLILHLLACRYQYQEDTTTTTTPDNWPHWTVTTTRPAKTTSADITRETLSPDIECTWEPSKPTKAETRYYLLDRHTRSEARSTTITTTITYKADTEASPEVIDETTQQSQEYDDDDDFLEVSDEKFAEETYNSHVVALVKLKPLGDATFGCILTKITRFWTVTAASCIESIEEVDSLDSFVMVEQFGTAAAARARAVADVRVHPQFLGDARGRDPRSYDVAALRAARALRAPLQPLRLPHALDYFLLAVGDRFHILGYGGYRTVDKSAAGRQLRQVAVHTVSAAQCAGEGAGAGAGEDAGWAARHLARGGAARAGACGARPLCAGALHGRGAPCHYCAGTPLLRAGALFGVMSDNSACAIACEPQLYVNVATLRDWIHSVIQ